MNIDTSSVIKAGGIAAGVGLVLAILSAVPFLNCLILPLTCLGGVLIPFGAGLGYGYWAPGKETLGQSALGGTLAGGFEGFVYGIVSGVVGTLLGAGLAAAEGLEGLPGAAAGGAVSLVLGLCGPIIGGLIFGALGGIAWQLFQGDRV